MLRAQLYRCSVSISYYSCSSDEVHRVDKDEMGRKKERRDMKITKSEEQRQKSSGP